ncbi:MAG: AbrB/MazE/SpoVT family DNA-binding domain-containing protein [Defluviitaleaceae bacterium]|nr:AbrB/MazE/SpoVT family DNA-binding domain-containing protein [Defluviitaleaceae bacterium]
MKIEFTHIIDELGRILIPAELREAAGWDAGDAITLNHSYGVITLLKKERTYECIGCKTPEVKVRAGGKDICETCLEKAVEIMAAQR